MVMISARDGRGFVAASFILLCGLARGGACQTAPPNTPSVRAVENAGLLFTDNPAGVSGTDAGYSLPLGNKQTLWLFGDVFLLDNSPVRSYNGFVSNCALLVPSGAGMAPLKNYTFLTDAKTGLARRVLSQENEEKNGLRYWPLGGWFDAKSKSTYLYYERVRTTSAGGPFGFKVEGHGLALANAAKPEELKFNRLPTAPDQEIWWNPEKEGSIFGSAVIAPPSGDYIYIVGEQNREGKNRGKMARVLKSRITGRMAYTYFTGNNAAPTWSDDVSKAADVEGLDEFPNELSISYNVYLGGYLAVHSIGINEKIRLSLAPNPWGPYRTIGEIGAPHRALAKAFCYAGKEHPELAQENGKIIYITYVDGDRYWLQMLKVTMGK